MPLPGSSPTYVDFGGRASRSEYWWWTGALFLAYVLAGLLVIVEPTIGLLLSAILLFGAFIPNLAVTVRRLHDVGRTGWWLLLHFIPFGSLVILVFTLLDTERGMNRWGAPAVGSSYVDPARVGNGARRATSRVGSGPCRLRPAPRWPLLSPSPRCSPVPRPSRPKPPSGPISRALPPPATTRWPSAGTPASRSRPSSSSTGHSRPGSA